jgi:predicted RNA binding protein YcfA (HicA-like mRNA interferase family)
MIATGAVLAASAMLFAQERLHMDRTQHMHGADAVTPRHPGQEAFGTIREIVRILEADHTTDWSKVNIGALREHLIDMDEVTLRARASERPLEDGIEITVTGEGRTLSAIKRMVPAHTRELVALGWGASTQDLPNGVKLVVTSSDPQQLIKLKALGFMGIMVQGAHHQPHHLMMAKGAFAH